MGALDGILVVALEQAVAAPLCSARLAEAGARVIKVERAEGDFARAYDHVVGGESAYFVWLNRGKESVVLDIKQPGDCEVLAALIAKADVFIQNLAPGAAARAGFGSAALRAAHLRLITVDISGFGDGPYRDMKAYDFLIQCETGLASITGGPNEAGRVGVSVADIGAGMNAHAAVLEALIARGRDGRGRGIAVSLFDTIAEWMTVPLLHFDHSGRAPGRAGLHHATIAPYGVYPVADGREIVLAVQNEREWAAFCAVVLRQPGLAADSRYASNSDRCANRAALDAILGGVLGALPKTEALDRLNAAAIAYAEQNSVADLSRHPALRRVEVATPGGTAALPAPPVMWDDRTAGSLAVPALGGATAAIRDEVGRA